MLSEQIKRKPVRVDDFHYMWRGKPVKKLTEEQAYLLSPVHIQGKSQEHALLLLHGFSSSPAVYRELVPLLSGYDRVICPTLPGHGESMKAFSQVKAEEWLLGVEKDCQTLMDNYQKVDVLGLSLGGLLACHLSQRFNLHHLFLLAPALALQSNITCALTLARVLKWLGCKQVRNRAGNIYQHHHAELAYRQLPVTTIIQILTLIQDYTFRPPTCPTDLFLGRYDKVVDTSLVADYFSPLANVTIHWLEQSAHVLPLDGDLEKIAACLSHHV